MVNVDECNGDEYGDKNEIDESLGGGAENGENANGQQTGEKFDQWITETDGRFAIPAFSPQYKETDYWNIVVKSDGGVTSGAFGSGPDNG